MGEARRRRLANKTLAEHAKEMHAEGGGVWRLDLYRFSPEVLPMAAAADNGDHMAQAIMEQIVIFSRQSMEPNEADRLLCLTCDQTFTTRYPPAYLGVLMAHTDDPSRALINGICHGCVRRFGDGEGIQRGAFEAYRRHLILDARRIEIHSETGRA